MDRLNKELEAALSIVRKYNEEPKNKECVLKKAEKKNVGDCIGLLNELGYIQDADSEHHYGGVWRSYSIRLTNKGRTYKSEKRRTFVARYMPVILGSSLGILGTLAGVCLGFYLNSI